MDLSSLFSGPRWAIISALGQKPLSPMQLADALGSTMANVSQQLRILEAYGLVKKERIPNRDKGKPRIEYSLKESMAFIGLASTRAPHQAMVSVGPCEELQLQIWSRWEGEIRQVLSLWAAHTSPFLDKISYLGCKSDSRSLSLMIIVEKSHVAQVKKESIRAATLHGKSTIPSLHFHVISTDNWSKRTSDDTLEGFDCLYRSDDFGEVFGDD